MSRQTKSTLVQAVMAPSRIILLICLFSSQASWSKDCSPAKINSEIPITSPAGVSKTKQEVDTFISTLMTEMKIPGASIAIINNAEVVFHHVSGVANVNTDEPLSTCTLFQGASISKPLFGFFVMSFVEEGVLDLDRPLYQYLPYEAIAHDERYKKITARMVLTHQSGFPNWRTDYPDKKLFIQFDPGSSFHYSGEGYQYLALVLQKIAKVDAAGLEALFQQRVAKKFGQTQTQIIASKASVGRTARPHKNGQLIDVTTANSFEDFGAAYGVHSEALDFSKWMTGLMNQQGLKRQSYEAYFRPQNTPIPEDEPERQLGLQDYALGFAIYKTPFGQLYVHGGNNPGYTSMIALERESKWGVVIFTNANQVSDFAIKLLFYLNTPA